mgnify:CR=1 FL=1
MVQRLNGWLRRLPVWAVWLAGLLPLALLVWDTLYGVDSKFQPQRQMVEIKLTNAGGTLPGSAESI